MKRNNLYVGLMAFAILLVGASCSDDDNTPSYSTGVVQNTELKTILVQRGYTFNEDGNLLLDDLAKNTTTLDLSGTLISTDALAELSMFPNLTDVDLSDNGYGPAFDFAKLPEQITGVDLTGNEIYDFEGLVDASVINDEVQATILHKLTKLYLPETAKWNVEDLMPFYTKNQTDGTNVDMQMVDEDGNLQAYNTLREIPDQYFRAYLKTKFNSLFVDDTHIDISKPMAVEEEGNSIYLWYKNQFADIDKIESIEGLEYFVNNPFYKTFYVSIGYATQFTVSYLAPRNNIKGFDATFLDTPEGIDLSKATKMAFLGLGHNPSITVLDLSNTLVVNQEGDEFDAAIYNGLYLESMENLKEIILPNPNKGLTYQICLIDLPSLTTMDLSSVEGLNVLALIKLDKCNITYPQLKYSYNLMKGFVDLSPTSKASFALSEDVLEKSSTTQFIETYGESLSDMEAAYRSYGATKWKK